MAIYDVAFSAGVPIWNPPHSPVSPASRSTSIWPPRPWEPTRFHSAAET